MRRRELARGWHNGGKRRQTGTSGAFDGRRRDEIKRRLPQSWFFVGGWGGQLTFPEVATADCCEAGDGAARTSRNRVPLGRGTT